jgi:hypothetical protein
MTAAWLAASGGYTQAQFKFTAIVNEVGPFTSTSFQHEGINLNTITGGPIPAGQYVWYSITADWNPDGVPSSQVSEEARAVLVSAPTTGGVTSFFPPSTRLYAGLNAASVLGYAPPNGQPNSTARSIGWQGLLDTPYVTDGSGTNGLYLYVRQTAHPGTWPAVRWRNVRVSLWTLAPAPPAHDVCSGATDISAAANAALASPGTWISPKLPMAGASHLPEDGGHPIVCGSGARKVIWVKFVPAVTGLYRISTCLDAEQMTPDLAESAFAVFIAPDGQCPNRWQDLVLLPGSCAHRNCIPSGLPGWQTPVFAQGSNIALTAGRTYFILIGRPFMPTQYPSLFGGQEEHYQFSLTRFPAIATCTRYPPDIRAAPFYNKATASANNTVVIYPGDVLCGVTTGSSVAPPMSLDSAHTWRIRVLAPESLAPPPIRRYQLAYSSLFPAHTVTLRGLNQLLGFVGTLDTPIYTLQPSGGLGPHNTLRWYVHGTQNRDVFIRVSGTLQTGAEYHLTASAADVSPIDAGTFAAGPITITSRGLGHFTDTDLWVYDADGNPIPGWGNDDTPEGQGGSPPGHLQSTLTRTFAAGTYYIAVSGYNLANHLPSPPDDGFLDGPVLDHPGVTASSSAPANPQNRTISITDAINPTRVVQITGTQRYEVGWVKLVVTEPQPTPCNAADLARTDGTPGPDGCVDNGDFLLFVGSFFGAECAATCGATPPAPCGPADIARTDGTPGSDGCVDNGDFLLFVGSFFSADCAASCGR